MTKQGYKIRDVQVVARGSDVQVRVLTLAPEGLIPWHYHSESNDHYYVLEGALSIETREPDENLSLGVGKSHIVAPGTKHCVSNRGKSDTRFLIIQGVGKYDWLKA
jgi:mannose-6-phosphate isomerase-like protein (cupin superfamily)